MSDDRLLTPRFIGMWCFAFVTFFSAFQLLPAIPFRIVELGGTKAQAGWFLAIYTFSSAFAAPVMGAIADALGRRRMLIGASILFIFFSIAYGVITWLPLLLVVGAIHGSLWSGLMASSSAIITDFIPLSRRTEGLAYWGLSSTAAIAVAPAVGLAVFHYGWYALCAELTILSAIMAAAATRIPTVQVVSELPQLGASWDWRVGATALSMTSIAFGYGGVTSYAAMLAVERHIKPPSLYFTAFAITIAAVRVFGSRLGDRYGVGTLLYPAFAAMPVAFAVLGFAETRWQIVASAILFGFGLGVAWPMFMTFILAKTDPRNRARTFGSVIWAFDTGIGSGSLIIGALGQRYGLGRAFLVAAGLSCLAIPLFLTTSRGLRAPEPLPEPLGD